MRPEEVEHGRLVELAGGVELLVLLGNRESSILPCLGVTPRGADRAQVAVELVMKAAEGVVDPVDDRDHVGRLPAVLPVSPQTGAGHRALDVSVDTMRAAPTAPLIVQAVPEPPAGATVVAGDPRAAIGRRLARLQ